MNTNSLFEEDWWLNAVAPEEWRAVEIVRSGKSTARLPYVLKKSRMGIRHIGMPALTQTLGPWLAPQEGKYANRLGCEKDLLQDLISQLPPHDSFDMRFDVSLKNWLPFFWKGYAQTTRYTYRIYDIANMEAVWDEFQAKARTDINKANRELTLRMDIGPEALLNLQRKSYERQSRLSPKTGDVFLRVCKAAQDRDAIKLLYAEDSQGRLHAGAAIVYDTRCAYYLVGGGDPALRSSGAQSFLIWEAIKALSGRTAAFDFEGSMVESIERFFRGFGARQTPYFHITKQSIRKAFMRNLSRFVGR